MARKAKWQIKEVVVDQSKDAQVDIDAYARLEARILERSAMEHEKNPAARSTGPSPWLSGAGARGELSVPFRPQITGGTSNWRKPWN